MIILINQYGVSIDKENRKFRIIHDEEIRHISPLRVTALHILKPCNISSPAILLANDHDIPLLFFNSAGRVKTRLWKAVLGNLPSLRRKQLYFSESTSSEKWMAELLAIKIQGQLKIYRHMASPSNSKKKGIVEINRISEIINILQNELPGIARLRVLEAESAKLYWKLVFEHLGQLTDAAKRTRQPATDQFNALLNYGYGMLYAIVETAILTVGLDPAVGVMHAEGYKRPALVFDGVEPFRPWVDRLVVDMVLSGEIKSEYFESKESGIWLNALGKKVFIPAYFEMMDQVIDFEGKRGSKKTHIQVMFSKLATRIMAFEPKL